MKTESVDLIFDHELHQVIKLDESRMYITPRIWRILKIMFEYRPGELIPRELMWKQYNQMCDCNHAFRVDLVEIRRLLKNTGWGIKTFHSLGWTWEKGNEWEKDKTKLVMHSKRGTEWAPYRP